MNEPRHQSRLSPALIVVGFLFAVLMVIYVAGYLLGSEFQLGPDAYDSRQYRSRSFRHEWQCFLYNPAAFTEAAIYGTPVELNFQIEKYRYRQYAVYGHPGYKIRGGEWVP